MNERHIYDVGGVGEPCYVRCYPPGHFPVQYGESKQQKHNRLYETTFVAIYGEKDIFKALDDENI
jgi:hypothetical protein